MQELHAIASSGHFQQSPGVHETSGNLYAIVPESTIQSRQAKDGKRRLCES